MDKFFCVLLIMFLYACSDARSTNRLAPPKQTAGGEIARPKVEPKKSELFIVVKRDYDGTYWPPRCFEDPLRKIVQMLKHEAAERSFSNMKIFDSFSMEQKNNDVVSIRSYDSNELTCKLVIVLDQGGDEILVPVEYRLAVTADDESYILTLFNSQATIAQIVSSKKTQVQ